MKIHPCVWPPDQFEGLCQISKKICQMEKIKTALCDLTKIVFRLRRFCYKYFFCKIIMGSPLNNNVPEGLSVYRFTKTDCNHLI